VIAYSDTEKDPERLASRLDADAVVLTQQRSPFPRAVIEKLRARLKLITQTGRNARHIDVAACTERGILVSVGSLGTHYSTAEMTWGLILASVRNIPYEAQRLKQGKWQSTLGTELHGKTLGIYALGHIGTYVAQVGKAFGMNIVVWGRESSQTKARSAGYDVAASRAAFFERADVLSLHLPLNSETRAIITAADLARMKTSALLVNTSRAPLIEKGALVDALKKGRPGYAAVDVFEEEPLEDASHPLLNMPNALCTPHLGYVVGSKYESYYTAMIDNLLAYAEGKPVNLVNPEAIGKD
jgi:D-3-phosphoglycerate dehydrogenase